MHQLRKKSYLQRCLLLKRQICPLEASWRVKQKTWPERYEQRAFGFFGRPPRFFGNVLFIYLAALT
jgi:hypothetical protein